MKNYEDYVELKYRLDEQKLILRKLNNMINAINGIENIRFFRSTAELERTRRDIEHDIARTKEHIGWIQDMIDNLIERGGR